MSMKTGEIDIETSPNIPTLTQYEVYIAFLHLHCPCQIFNNFHCQKEWKSIFLEVFTVCSLL